MEHLQATASENSADIVVFIIFMTSYRSFDKQIKLFHESCTSS